MQIICKDLFNPLMHLSRFIGLFNGIPTPYKIFNDDIWFICNSLIVIIIIYIFNISLQSFFELLISICL